MTRNITECQQRLIDLKFLPPLKADGKSAADGTFGTDSLAAFNRFLAQKGKPPIGHKQWTLTQISAALFPEDAPPPPPKASNPITDYLTQLAIKAVLNNLKGRLPMLTGYKTYATAIVIAVMAIYAALFGDLPLVGHVDLGTAILAFLSSLGLSFARTGAKTEAQNAVSDK